MKDDLVNMWVWKQDRDFIRIEAAKRRVTMADIVKEAISRAKK